MCKNPLPGLPGTMPNGDGYGNGEGGDEIGEISDSEPDFEVIEEEDVDALSSSEEEEAEGENNDVNEPGSEMESEASGEAENDEDSPSSGANSDADDEEEDHGNDDGAPDEVPDNAAPTPPTESPTFSSGDEYCALDVVTLRELILNSQIPEPILFKGIHSTWGPVRRSVTNFGDILIKEFNTCLECKQGLKKFDSEKPQWESARRTKMLKWNQMIDWDKKQRNSNHWIYYDYKAMKDVVHREYLKEFEWSRLGFPERTGGNCSLWIGSAGSFTPCHYDTYGCNLVCQIKGRKKWILFPPTDTTYLCPTRVPYEESSVYSQINFCAKNSELFKINGLQKCSPISVTLEPGDVLYVPPKWWHFVQAEEFSISVNTWIELPEDHLSRLDEAIVRSIVGSSLAISPPETILDVLNPNEEQLLDITSQEIDTMLEQASEKYFESKDEDESFDEPPRKKQRITAASFDDFLNVHSDVVTKLDPYKFCPPEQKDNSESEPITTNPTSSLSYYSHLINAIGHPNILQLIREQFLQNIQNNRTAAPTNQEEAENEDGNSSGSGSDAETEIIDADYRNGDGTDVALPLVDSVDLLQSPN